MKQSFRLFWAAIYRSGDHRLSASIFAAIIGLILPGPVIVAPAAALTTYSLPGASTRQGAAEEINTRQDFTFSLASASTLTFSSLVRSMGQSCSGTGTYSGVSYATIYLDLSSAFSSGATYFEQIQDSYTFGAGGETHKPSIGLNCKGIRSAVSAPCSVTLNPGDHTLHILLQDQFTGGLSASPSAFSEVVTTTVSGVAESPEPGSLVLLGSGMLGLLLARRRLIVSATNSSRKL